MFETNGALKTFMLAGIVLSLVFMGLFQLAVWLSDRARARATSSPHMKTTQRSTQKTARKQARHRGNSSARRLRGNRTGALK